MTRRAPEARFFVGFVDRAALAEVDFDRLATVFFAEASRFLVVEVEPVAAARLGVLDVRVRVVFSVILNLSGRSATPPNG